MIFTKKCFYSEPDISEQEEKKTKKSRIKTEGNKEQAAEKEAIKKIRKRFLLCSLCLRRKKGGKKHSSGKSG